jgi:anti-sigma regulatory factor (Ser/Thr protein kinase)
MNRWKVNNYIALKQMLKEWTAFLQEEQVFSDAIFNSKLVIDELAGNIIKHAKGEAEVKGKVENGFILLQIHSTKPYIPPKETVCSEVFAESGRGLFIVDKICYSRTSTNDGGIEIRIKIEKE